MICLLTAEILATKPSKASRSYFFLLRTCTMKVRGSFPSRIAYVLQNQGGPCNCWLPEEETKRQIFKLMCRCGSLWLFPGSLWLFAGGLRSFVLVCARFYSLPALVITNSKCFYSIWILCINSDFAMETKALSMNELKDVFFSLKSNKVWAIWQF